MKKKNKSSDLFENMEGHEFEYYCAELLKKRGFIDVTVTKGSGDYVWQRLSRPMEYSISGLIPQTAAQEENGELAACLKMLLEYNGSITDVAGELAAGKNAMEILNGKIDGRQGYDLTGCSFTEMLYYVCKGQPVMGQLNGNHYVLIVGYDFYNAVLFDPATGTTYKNGQEETTAMFEEYGKHSDSKLHKSVMDLIMQANERIFKEAKGNMCNALRELFKEEIDEAKKDGIKELVVKKLAKGKSVEQIADELEQTVEMIEELIKSLEK